MLKSENNIPIINHITFYYILGVGVCLVNKIYLYHNIINNIKYYFFTCGNGNIIKTIIWYMAILVGSNYVYSVNILPSINNFHIFACTKYKLQIISYNLKIKKENKVNKTPE